MGRAGEVAQQWQELVRGAGEPRWTAVVDALLAFAVVTWVLVLGFFDPDATARLAVPLVLVVAVVARVLVLVEYSQRWRDAGLGELVGPRGDTSDESSRAAA